MSGVFITMEGIEGCGKSTQTKRLADHLQSSGHEVVVTREPGGVPIAEAIRELLLNPAHSAMSDTAELLLYEAARAQHVDELIRPALDRGAVVICDRFTDSTTAYQGGGRAIDRDIVLELHRIATGGLTPDITFLFDLDPEVGLKRATRDSAPDRLESEAIEFHQRVRESFLEIAKAEPNRFKIVDAQLSPDDVFAAVCERVESLVRAV